MEAFWKLHQVLWIPNCTDRYNFTISSPSMWECGILKFHRLKKSTSGDLHGRNYFFQILNLATRNRFLATGTSNDVGRSLAISTYILFPLLYFGRVGAEGWLLLVFVCVFVCLLGFLFNFYFFLIFILFYTYTNYVQDMYFYI